MKNTLIAAVWVLFFGFLNGAVINPAACEIWIHEAYASAQADTSFSAYAVDGPLRVEFINQQGAEAAEWIFPAGFGAVLVKASWLGSFYGSIRVSGDGVISASHALGLYNGVPYRLVAPSSPVCVP